MTSPGFPIPLPISAFNILYLSPLYIKKAPGVGYRPFILPIMFCAESVQSISPSDF